MQIPPLYQITPEMISFIAKIDTNKEIISKSSPPTEIIDKIHRSSLLKSSLYSARIEGHTATLDELDEKRQEQLEIFNILKAIKYVDRQITDNNKLTVKTLTAIHALTLQGINSAAGKLRRETSAIFNQAGVAVYMPPPPVKITEYLQLLLDYMNSSKEPFPLINAFISHLIFEKIHPFLDGNGRVGRLLIYALFKSKGYNFGIHVPFEEYIDSHKQDYYYYLDIGLQQPNDYLLFMLKSYYEQTESVKRLLAEEQNNPNKLFLPPRQEEIYHIIKDHQTVSLDFIKRRFAKIPDRTLRYDLKRLVEQGHIVKIGRTRGAFYTLKKN